MVHLDNVRKVYLYEYICRIMRNILKLRNEESVFVMRQSLGSGRDQIQ